MIVVLMNLACLSVLRQHEHYFSHGNLYIFCTVNCFHITEKKYTSLYKLIWCVLAYF